MSDRRRQRGFTVFELLITLMIVGLLFGAGLQVIRRGFGHEGRLLALKLQGISRYLYNQAILQNRTYRMVFDLHASDPTQATVAFEVATGDYVRAKPDADKQSASDKKTAVDDDAKKPADEEAAAGPAIVNPTRAQFEAVPREGGLLSNLKMPQGVLLAEVRMAGAAAAQTDGKAYVHFLPQGAADGATIVLANAAKNQFFSLRLSPLTGIMRITREGPADE